MALKLKKPQKYLWQHNYLNLKTIIKTIGKIQRQIVMGRRDRFAVILNYNRAGQWSTAVTYKQ